MGCPPTFALDYSCAHQPHFIAIGRADILQNVFGCLLLQLDIVALGNGHKTVLDLTAHAAGGIRQQRRKLIFKIILSILPDR